MKQLLTKFFKDKTYRIINVSMIQNSFYFTVNIFYSTKTNVFVFVFFKLGRPGCRVRPLLPMFEFVRISANPFPP